MLGGLTHCGFGGTLEFITSGVPVVAFPHFGDQHDNAEQLEKRKVGVILHNKVRISNDNNVLASYIDPAFDAQKVYECFNEILTNEIYSHNIKKIQNI